MKRTVISILLIFSSIAVLPQSVQFLINPSDAITLGNGGAVVASDATYTSIYSNPASMALSDNKMSIGASYGIFQPNNAKNGLVNISGFYKTDRFGIGAGLRSFSYQSYNISKPSGQTEATFKPSESVFDLGVAYKFSSNFSTGIDIKYASSSIAEGVKGSAIAVDVGIMYKKDNFSLAASTDNIGTKIEYSGKKYSLPTILKFGGSYDLNLAQLHILNFTIEADYLTPAENFLAGFGAQYAYNDMLKLRTGLHYGDKVKAIPSYLSAGLGVCFSGLSLDFAIILSTPSEALKNSFILGLSYTL